MSRAREKLMLMARNKAAKDHQEARQVHKEAAAHDSLTNGFTKGRTMRRIASVPTREMARLKAEVPMEDTKYVKDWIKKNGYETVPGKF